MRKLGALDGAGALVRGIQFVFGTPGVRTFAIVPVMVAGALLVGLGAAGVLAALALGARLGGDGLAGSLLTAVFVMASLFGAFVLAMSLAQPLSSFALDRIVRAQEVALGVAPPLTDAGGSFFRSLRVTLVSLAIGAPLLLLLTVLEILVPPLALVTWPLKLVVTAALLAWDFLDYPLGLRGLGVRDRAAWMRAHPGAVLGFGLTATVLLMIPGVGLLVLPAAVAGATRMVSTEAAGLLPAPNRVEQCNVRTS